MPEISVIVPVYNVEAYLKRCIESILAQTYTDFELILVDDGSPDGCPDICDEYEKKDGRIHVIHQSNGGVSVARNKGIEWVKSHSDSQWISFIDSDDWVHPLFLERLLQAAKNNQVPVSCCRFQRVREGELLSERNNCEIVLRQTVDVYCSALDNGIEAYPWRFLYNIRLFNNVAFPAGRIYEDVFTTHKLIFQAQKIAEVNQCLYYYFYHETSLSHSAWTPRQLDLIEAYEENLRYFQGSDSFRLIKCLARGYLFAIHTQYTQLNKLHINVVDKNHYKRVLKQKMRIALRHYAKPADVSIKNSGYLYAVAYPHLVELYWMLNGQIKKLKQ